MVQIKRLVNYISLKEDVLYIPHGSDKTRRINYHFLTKHPFISHMVQIKLEDTLAGRANRDALYPTWFR